MSQFKNIKFWGAALLIILATFLIITKLTATDDGGENNLPVAAISDSDWTLGTPEAKVTLIEYSDFQCPACAYFSKIIEQVMVEFDQHVYFAYRHFPLSIHQNSIPSARAAEAAGLQGKFWEMSAKLFENQKTWSVSTAPEEIFTGYAEELGLNLEKFKDDYNSSEVKNAVEDDLDDADSLGLNSTPSFFLNGEKLNQNPRDLNSFRTIIRSALESNS